MTALQSEATYFASTLPQITGVTKSGPTVTVLYRTNSVAALGSTSLSVTWIRIAGAWRIFYDPFLNNAMRQAAENAISPGTTPSRQALAAGERAAQLQQVYLDQVERK